MTELREVQRQLSDHIRDPEAFPGPAGVEPRRLKIYQELFFNTVEGFLSTAFPVVRSLYPEAGWKALVRDFMRIHRCASPFFIQVAEEFLHYLSQERQTGPDDPPYLLELAHYEWVELALDVSTEELPPIAEPPQPILRSRLRRSPLAWSLSYSFPVHRIGADSRPAAEPTFLVVYRNRHDKVGFLEINAATARLLRLLDAHEGRVASALAALAEEMAVRVESLHGFADQLLEQLFSLDVLLAIDEPTRAALNSDESSRYDGAGAEPRETHS